MSQNHLSTLRQILNVEGGLDESCRIVDNKLVADTLEVPADPEDLQISKSYRFEGNTNPDDMAVLYVIKNDKGFKGALINGYGPQADTDIHNFIDKLEKSRDTQHS